MSYKVTKLQKAFYQNMFSVQKVTVVTHQKCKCNPSKLLIFIVIIVYSYKVTKLYINIFYRVFSLCLNGNLYAKWFILYKTCACNRYFVTVKT